MKEEEDNISQFFNNRLSNKEFPFDEAQWNALSEMLDAEEGLGEVIYHKPWYSRGIKAIIWISLLILFVLFLGWYFQFYNRNLYSTVENLIEVENPNTVLAECEGEYDQDQHACLVEQQTAMMTSLSEDELCFTVFDTLEEIDSKNGAYTSFQKSNREKPDKTLVNSGFSGKDNSALPAAKKQGQLVVLDVSDNTKDNSSNDFSSLDENLDSERNREETLSSLASVGSLIGENSLQYINNIQYVLFPLEISTPDIVFLDSIAEDTTAKEDETDASKWSFILFLAPDFNSTSYAELYKNIGEAVGVAAQYQMLERFSINFGVTLANKVYTAEKGDYTPIKGFWTGGFVPDATDAQCLVLDIPVSIGFRLVKINHHTIWLSSGISSYWMLAEDYQYIYDTPNAEARQQWIGERESFHFSGALDLSITYERQLTKHFSMLIQPYYKSPLKGIGHGSVELLSSGVNIGLKYHL